VGLLILEALIPESPAGSGGAGAGKKRRPRWLWSLVSTWALGGWLVFLCACGWDPKKPFDRESPEVRAAMAALDAGEAGAAASTLEEYLSTGACAEGNIGAPPRVTERPNGSFDLGLALFQLGERYGARFGDEERKEAPPEEHAARMAQVDCALRIVRAVANDDAQPVDLRAHARYLEGNLLFLGGSYEDAVQAYDKALVLAPAMVDAGEAVGRDAAWNRAIAMRRIEDKKDAGADGGGDAGPPDGGGDGGGEGGAPDGGGGQDGGAPNQGDAGGDKDAGEDSGGGGDDGGAPPPPEPDAGIPPPSRASQDDRMLDQLENAPTVQKEAAKKQAQRRRRLVTEDK